MRISVTGLVKSTGSIIPQEKRQDATPALSKIKRKSIQVRKFVVAVRPEGQVLDPQHRRRIEAAIEMRE